MIFETLEIFASQIQEKRAIIGLDLGEKTIGVAISDIDLTVATGLKTLRRKKFKLELQLLLRIIEAREITGIVLGLPKNMNGSEGRRCQSTRAFAKNLSNKIELPITFWDERLSTVAAEKTLLEANTSRKRRAQIIDFVAASYILQGALDRMSQLKLEKMKS